VQVRFLEEADATSRGQYTVALWNACIFACTSVTSHPEWAALVSGFRLNGVQLDVSTSFQALCALLMTNKHKQFLTLDNARAIMTESKRSKVKHPSQVVSLLRFSASTQHRALSNTLKATVAVFGLHLTRYLHGVGHPQGSEKNLKELSSASQHELSVLGLDVLRAQLFLRVLSVSDFVPVDTELSLNVRREALTLTQN
jgi:hypothetical protein